MHAADTTDATPGESSPDIIRNLFHFTQFTWTLIPILFSFHFTPGSSMHIAMLAFIALWIGSGVLVKGKKLWPWVVSIALALMAWLLPAYQLIRRIAYVVQHQAMDDENSSPAAFALGLVFEQIFFFIPLTIIIICGTIIVKRRINRPPDAHRAHKAIEFD